MASKDSCEDDAEQTEPKTINVSDENVPTDISIISHIENSRNEDIQFVEGEVEAIDCMCSICISVMTEPILMTQCGHSYCNTCLDTWISTCEAGVILCPLDKTVVDRDQIVPDLKLGRSINGMKTYCRNKKDGCKHTPELRYFQIHLVNCEYRRVSCPLRCGESMTMLSVGQHMENDCVKLTSAKVDMQDYMLLLKKVENLTVQVARLSEIIFTFESEKTEMKVEIMRLGEVNLSPVAQACQMDDEPSAEKEALHIRQGPKVYKNIGNAIKSRLRFSTSKRQDEKGDMTISDDLMTGKYSKLTRDLKVSHESIGKLKDDTKYQIKEASEHLRKETEELKAKFKKETQLLNMNINKLKEEIMILKDPQLSDSSTVCSPSVSHLVVMDEPKMPMKSISSGVRSVLEGINPIKSRPVCGPFYGKVVLKHDEGFSTKRKSFYTSGGFKMNVKIMYGGWNTFKIVGYLVAGDNDKALTWPWAEDVCVQVKDSKTETEIDVWSEFISCRQRQGGGRVFECIFYCDKHIPVNITVDTENIKLSAMIGNRREQRAQVICGLTEESGYTCPFTWRVVMDGENKKSPSFTTSDGYTLAIVMVAVKNYNKRNYRIEVYLLKGKNDDTLPWPWEINVGVDTILAVGASTINEIPRVAPTVVSRNTRMSEERSVPLFEGIQEYLEYAFIDVNVYRHNQLTSVKTGNKTNDLKCTAIKRA